MKLIPKPMARRRTAIAALRSLGGPQIPSPVRRMAPKPRRLTVSSPPKSIVPQSAADRLVAFSLMFFLQRRSFVRYRLVYSAACQLESGLRFKSFASVGVFDPRFFSYTIPLLETMKVMTPDVRRSAGYATKSRPPFLLPPEA